MKKPPTDDALKKKLEILNYEKSELLVHLKFVEMYYTIRKIISIK